MCNVLVWEGWVEKVSVPLCSKAAKVHNHAVLLDFQIFRPNAKTALAPEHTHFHCSVRVYLLWEIMIIKDEASLPGSWTTLVESFEGEHRNLKM